MSVQEESKGIFNPVSFRLSSPVFPGRALLTILLYELRLQLRSRYFQCIVILYLGFAIFQLSPALDFLKPPVQEVGASLFFCASVTGFMLILNPFAFFNVFARDTQRKMVASVWTRPVSSIVYVVGKVFAVIVLNQVLSLVSLCLGWLVLSSTAGHLMAPDLWLHLMLVFNLTQMFEMAFVLVCVNIVPWAFLGALIVSGSMFYLDKYRPTSLMDFWNVTPKGLFFSPSIGFGPDLPLLTSQRLSLVAFAVLCFFILLLAFQLRTYYIARSRFSLLLPLCLCLLTLIPTFAALDQYRQAYAHTQSAGPTKVQPLKAQVSHYSLQLTSDPTLGHLQGRATFQVTPQITGSPFLSMILNPGLLVQSISTASGQSLQYTSNTGWTRVDLSPTAFIQGRPVQLQFVYKGRLPFSRDNYASFSGFNQNATAYPQEYFSYLGQGTMFLEGNGGDWYPLPWVTGALDRVSNRLLFDNLHLRLPAKLQVYCPQAHFVPSIDGVWQDALIQPKARLPLAFLAAFTEAHKETLRGVPTFYRQPTLTSYQRQLYGLMNQQTPSLERVFGGALLTTGYWQAVVLPLLTDPVVGAGLVFLPEIPPDSGYNFTSDTAVSRFAGQAIAHSWLSNRLQIGDSFIHNAPRNIQRPQGSVGFSYTYTSSLLVYELLTNYSSAITTDQIRGGNYLYLAVTSCEQKLANKQGRYGTKNQQIDSQLTQQMYSLGISYCGAPEMLMYTWAHRYGEAQFKLFVREYLAKHTLDTQPATTLRGFLTELQTYFKSDLRRESAQGLCDSPPANPQDPLSCLSVYETD